MHTQRLMPISVGAVKESKQIIQRPHTSDHTCALFAARMTCCWCFSCCCERFNSFCSSSIFLCWKRNISSCIESVVADNLYKQLPLQKLPTGTPATSVQEYSTTRNTSKSLKTVARRNRTHAHCNNDRESMFTAQMTAKVQLTYRNYYTFERRYNVLWPITLHLQWPQWKNKL